MARWHPLDPVTADVARRGHLTPGRSHAFVGSYGPSDEHGIHVVGIDRGRGSLSRLGGVGGIRNPSFLALHPRSTHLYAVSEVGLASDGTQGHVYALRIDGRHDGVDLAVVSRRSTAGDHPCHISVDASGTWLAVTNYGTGDIVVFPIAGDGTIGEMASRVRHVGRGADPDRQSAPHPHSTIFTPDNRFVIVADLGIDRLVVYAFDERDGSLRERFSHGAAEGAGPRQMAFHPDGTHLFTVNELANTVSVLRWDAGASLLEDIQSLSTLGDIQAENLAADIRVAPSGRCVYVSNRGHDSIAAYSFDPSAGLEHAGVYPSGGTWPRGFGVTPEGGNVLVANERSDTVDLMQASSSGCRLETVTSRIAIARPTCVVFT
jgi:6-phosphogluconolactonase